MRLVTTRSGLVHVTGCRALRADTEQWSWVARNDGPGVAHACRVCLPGGLPEGEK
jgi:hypothetical protein